MKVVFSVLFFMAIILIPALSISVNVSSSYDWEISGDDFLFKAGKNGILFKSPSFSFGNISSGGIIHMLDNPYSTISFKPAFYKYKKSSALYGASWNINEKMCLLSFSGERDGVGFSYDSDRLSLLFVSVLSSVDLDYQKSTVLRRNTAVSYLASQYRMKYFSLFVLSSLSSLYSFNALFRLSLSFSLFSLQYGRGRVQSLISVENPYYSYFSFKIESDVYFFRNELRLMNDPIYINQYRDYEYTAESRLKILNAVLSVKTEKTFTSGKEKRNEIFSLFWNGFTFGWKSSGASFFAQYEKDRIKIDYTDGALSIRVGLAVNSDAFTIEMSFSSKKMMAWTISAVI